MRERQRLAHFAAITGYFSLFSLLMLWNTLIAPSPRLPVALVLLLTVTPLLLPLRGLLHGQPRACTWAAFLSLAYFVHGIVEFAAGPAERLLAGLEILFSSLLFFGAVYTARFGNR